MAFKQYLQSIYSKLNFRLSNFNLAVALLSLFFCIPIIVICGSLFFPAKDVWAHLLDTVLIDYIFNSFTLLIGVGCISVILGVIPAWLITMYKFPMSRYLEWALLLPMSMPAYIIAYSYTGAFDASGPIQEAIRDFAGGGYNDYWFPEVRSLGGAVAMLSFVLYHYIYLLSRASFIEQSVCDLEVSRTLGCNTRKSKNCFKQKVLF